MVLAFLSFVKETKNILNLLNNVYNDLHDDEIISREFREAGAC